ncbi:recombinase family protein [Paenibacillus harenae]|uniref:recombinase family protein n=1 Tax=Paenibacillus harenae TaxID=306543 RepID=UPI000408431B|nr:recombinase family protein [Paenibacillus harenae]
MNIAIYIRVSTDEQVQGFSIDVQKERLSAFCTSQGWDDPKLYIDDGYTGTNMNRPALKRLIRHIEESKIDTVIVYKLDRLGRKQKDVLHLLEDVFDKNNVAFKSATEPFDTGTSLGKAMIGILAVFAQLERDMIIERTTSGRRQRTGKGMWYGGRLAFGYEWNKDAQMLEVKPEEAHIVREIFKKYLNGESRLSIAEWAAKRTKSRKFDHSIIREILSRVLYTGKLINAGEVVEGNHEPIIDIETWEAVQAETTRRKDGGSPVGEYLLTGLLVCGVCGGNIVHVKRITNRAGRQYVYELYACKKQHVRKKDRAGESCTLGYYRREKVEQFVIDEIRKLSVSSSRVKEVIDKKQSIEPDANIRTNLQSKLDSVVSGIENLYDAIQTGAVKASAISDRLSKLEEERESIQLQLDEIEVAPVYRDYKIVHKRMKEFNKAWPFLTEPEQKRMLRSVVTHVVLNKDEDHEVIWNAT